MQYSLSLLATIAYSFTFCQKAMAHGVVSDIKIGNQWYKGSDPWNTKEDSSRRIVWSFYGHNNDPVDYVSSKDIVCNGNAASAPVSAPVSAGSQIELFWTKWPENHKGPVITYLADCKGKCSEVSDPSSLGWFKIDHDGLYPDTHTWAADKLRTNNNSWTVTIPSDIKPGNYLLRHEILALHMAYDLNGGQFYPMCANLEISGSGNAEPSTVKFPGAYQASDPGIHLNIWWPTPTSYAIPGPTVYNGGGKPAATGNGSQQSATANAFKPAATGNTSNGFKQTSTTTLAPTSSYFASSSSYFASASAITGGAKSTQTEYSTQSVGVTYTKFVTVTTGV